MISASLFKILVLVTLAGIFLSLLCGGIFMVRDRGHGKRPVIFLSIRIFLSLCLFVLLFIGFAYDLINPHTGPGAEPEQVPVSAPVVE